MADYPAWKDMTPDQKLDYLKEWLENIDRAVKNIRQNDEGLFQKIREVEAKIAGKT
jgi:hypothetical protein